MNALDMAQRAYAPTTAPMRSNRSVEYEVIARVTYRLKKAVEAGQFARVAEALYENRKLWRALAIDVSDHANGLPADLRARVFYLAEFTNAHTREVLAKRATAVPLLEVNTAILRGLKPIGAR